MITYSEPSSDNEWDSYITTLDNYSFLNSSFRFKYEKDSGLDVFRFFVCNNGDRVGSINGHISNSKIFGKFMECKHSPSLKSFEGKFWEDTVNFLTEFAKEKGCFMLRLSPLVVREYEKAPFFRTQGMFESPIHSVDALISQYFDLTKSEEDLRHDMTDSTRNNLNKLLKNSQVSVRVVNDMSEINVFNRMYVATELQKGFIGKSVADLNNELKIQCDSGNCYFLIGYFNGTPVSVWQCTRYGKYLHVYQAGSDTEFREKNIRMPYLLFWKSAELGKNLGCKVLDLFGGVVPDGNIGRNHPWKGVSSFKESFGGKKITYQHPIDVPIKRGVYNIYYPYAYIRTILKGYPVKW